MIIPFTTPTDDLVAAFLDDRVTTVRWVDIYEQDGVTLWREQVGPETGSVAVDMSRDERRNLSLTLYGNRGEITYGPSGLWYDKIIKPWRGIRVGGDEYVTCLGEFMIDTIQRPGFPERLEITARDYVKKLQESKFAETTTFAAGTNVGAMIKAVALNGGITKFDMQTITATLPEAVTFDRGSPRWEAVKTGAESIAHEAYFDGFAYLVVRPFVDPATAPSSFQFLDSGPTSSLASFTRSTSDTLLKNDVIVYSNNDQYPLVYGHAENVNPASPTRIEKVGRRTYSRESNLVTTNAQAQTLAEAYLAVMGLEQYDMSIESLVLPWMEAGNVVSAHLSDVAITDPTSFLFSSFTIPMELGTMSGAAKRVTIVG